MVHEPESGGAVAERRTEDRQVLLVRLVHDRIGAFWSAVFVEVAAEFGEELARAVGTGLELAIKHNLVFNCYRSAWAPLGEIMTESRTPDVRHGTVIGACEREAAVYALAHLREAEAELQPATV